MASVSLRYAKALADVVLERRQQDAVPAELQRFAAMLAESKELVNVLTNPAVSAPEKKNLIEALAERASFSSTTRNFLKIIADHHRFNIFTEIVAAFRRELDARLGIESVEVISAAPLTDGQKNVLVQQLSAFTHKEIRPHYQMDAELIGGVVTKIGSTIYDGSIREQLRRLRTEMSGD